MLNPDELNQQGITYCQNGEIVRGMKLFRQALTLNPRPGIKMVLNHNLALALSQWAGVVWGPGGKIPVNERNISDLDEALKCWSKVCKIYEKEVEGTAEEKEFIGTPSLKEYMKTALNNGFAISVKLDQFRGTEVFKKEEESSGGCFIATAVYENEYSPEVLYLREFRDDVLSMNILGRMFINIYYKVSPFLAQQISKSHIIKVTIRRVILCPLIGFLGRIYRKSNTTL